MKKSLYWEEVVLPNPVIVISRIHRTRKILEKEAVPVVTWNIVNLAAFLQMEVRYHRNRMIDYVIANEENYLSVKQTKSKSKEQSSFFLPSKLK